MKTAENNIVDTAMEKLLDRLITVIGDEASLFEKFLELLERQQQALITNDSDELKTLTARLQQVVAQSQRLEKERLDTIEQIRQNRNSETDLNVRQICDMADSARSNQLHAFRETILGLYGRIEETRMRNGLLIEQSLEQIQNTIEMIGRIPAKKDTYRKHGGLSGDFNRLGVDRRV
jgi:flagellar biosynthesis/type III secretory pathway chaperone